MKFKIVLLLLATFGVSEVLAQGPMGNRPDLEEGDRPSREEMQERRAEMEREGREMDEERRAEMEERRREMEENGDHEFDRDEMAKGPRNKEGKKDLVGKKDDMERKELDKGSEQGQTARQENSRKWWKFWGD